MNKTTNAKFQRFKKDSFYWILMIWPIIWFLVFYVYLNSSSVIYAFMQFKDNKYVWNGLNNFKRVFTGFFSDPVLSIGLKHSFLVYFFGFFAGLFLGQLFSFYIYKAFPFSKFFRTILFLPSIIPGIAFVLCFKYITDRVIPNVYNKITGNFMEGLLSNPDTAFQTLVFYFFWVGYAGSTVIYSNAMKNNIGDEMIEAALMEGLTGIKEYFYITFPLIFPTMQIFILTDIGAILTNGLNIYSFYGESADPSIYMVGYYLFNENLHSSSFTIPYLSALNIIVGLIPVPIVFLVKHFTDKYIDNLSIY